MKILYYDCFCGISGDMNLGALLDLGVPEDYLRRELDQLGLSQEYHLHISRGMKNGITGTRVDVQLTGVHEHDEQEHEHQGHSRDHTHGHAHDHGYAEGPDHHHDHPHEHEHHDEHVSERCEHCNDCNNDILPTDHTETHAHNAHVHADAAAHVHGDHHHHEHRNLRDIEMMIAASRLSDRVKQSSLAMFRKVAEAEAKVHGKSLYEVHFHEVGATDSIVDFVGAAICLDYLQVDRILSSPVQLGGGFVRCAHGTIPVPAPATVEIMRGVPVKTGLVPFETTTPTGAAILAANVQEFTGTAGFSVEKTGYGIGHRDLDIPNVLRVFLGTAEGGEERQTQYILETNIDDMNPELYGYVEEKLLERGALDVYKTAIWMKKGRPAIKLSVLVDDRREQDILDVIFQETTSIGVRKYKVEKIMLQRDFGRVQTPYGEVTVKNSYYQGEKIKYKPEYEDCQKIARERKISIAKVYREVYKAAEEQEEAGDEGNDGV